MSWHILILGNSLLVAISLLCMRAVAKQKGTANSSFVVNAVFYLFQFLAGLCLLPLLDPVQTEKLVQYWPWFLFAGIAFSMTNIATYKMLSYLDSGISGVLTSLYTLFAIILAALTLHEELTVYQAIGGGILVLSVCYTMLIARKHSKHHSVKNPWAWGLMYGVLAAIFYAVAVVNEKHLVDHMNAATYIVFGWGLQVLISQILAVTIQPSQFKIFRQSKTLLLTGTGGLVRGLSGFLLILSLIKTNNVALVTVSANFRMIFLVLLGAWLLKERQKLKEKLFAVSAAVVGLAIIFWK